MTTQVSDCSTTRSVEFPADAFEEIECAAGRYGLGPTAYLLLLHAVRSGRVDPSLMESVRELFTNDRAILKELAK